MPTKHTAAPKTIISRRTNKTNRQTFSETVTLDHYVNLVVANFYDSTK